MVQNSLPSPQIVEVPCPDCGQLSPEPIERVADNDAIPCSLCGGLIDLADASCKEIVSTAKRRILALR